MEEDKTGWIKLSRGITKWGWYQDHTTFRLFLHLLLTANWKESTYKGHTIGRGEVVVGVNALSSQIGMSVQATRTSLKKLEKTGEINKRATNKFSIVTLCNYDTYQSRESSINKPTTNQQQTNNKQATTSKEVKKERSNDDDGFIFFGIDIRTIDQKTRQGTKRTLDQLKHIAKLQSEGIEIN